MSFIAPNRLIYLAHPRTASIATERALAKMFSGSMKTKNHHAQLHEIDGRIGNEKIVTTVRDPLDLIASWYANNPAWHKWGMLHFIENYGHDMMARNGVLFYFLGDCDNHLRYESLQHDFDIIMNDWGFKTAIIERANVTEGKKPFMEYHNGETIKAMWDKYPLDMDMYYD